MTQALQFILALLLLVITHEAGHFLFARLFGVRVEKFYVFFNPWLSLFQAKKYDGKWHFRFLHRSATDKNEDEWHKHPEKTEWGIGWLPLGGYCKIAGMIDESLDENVTKQHVFQPWEYQGVSPYKRLPIITGGVLVNFFSALLIYAAIFFTWGSSELPIQNITTGFEFSPTALKAGFQNGDRLVKSNGEYLENYDEHTLRTLLKAQTVVVSRNGQYHTISLPEDFDEEIIANKEFFLTPILPFVVDSVMTGAPADGILQKGDSLIALNGKTQHSFTAFKHAFTSSPNNKFCLTFVRQDSARTTEIQTDSIGHIGVIPYGYNRFFHIVKKEYSVIGALTAGVTEGVKTLSGYVSDFRYLFSDNGYKNLGGFASIGSMFSSVWNWQWFWSMTALLAIILAFMNILPIPGLDGGHLFFLLYEIFTGRKPSTGCLVTAQYIGMFLILMLFILANLNDFMR